MRRTRLPVEAIEALMYIDSSFCCGTEEITEQHPLEQTRLTCPPPPFLGVWGGAHTCIFIPQTLNCVSHGQCPAVCQHVCCVLFKNLCLSSLLSFQGGQGGLLWQQLLFMQRPLCVRALLSPGRAGQTGPVHMEPAPLVSFVVALGVFLIGGCSMEPQAAPAADAESHFLFVCNKFAVISFLFKALCPFSVSLISFSSRAIIYLCCVTGPAVPLSVCIHHLSGWIWLELLNRALQSFIGQHHREQRNGLSEEPFLKLHGAFQGDIWDCCRLLDAVSWLQHWLQIH